MKKSFVRGTWQVKRAFSPCVVTEGAGRTIYIAGHTGQVDDAGKSLAGDFDAGGQLVTGSFMDYAMPRAADIPDVEVQSNPVPTKTNPLGVKGAGEAGCVGAMPAVANALVDALSHLGIRHVEMPATPERLWRAIKDARHSGRGGDS